MSISQTRQLVLKHEGAENFNWNYVDQHVLGYQDFAELPEVSTSLSTITINLQYFCWLFLIVFTISKVSLSLLAAANRTNVGR